MDTLAEAEMDAAAAGEYIPADKQSLAVEALIGGGCTSVYVSKCVCVSTCICVQVCVSKCVCTS
jgi:hypothetical protein